MVTEKEITLYLVFPIIQKVYKWFLLHAYFGRKASIEKVSKQVMMLSNVYQIYSFVERIIHLYMNVNINHILEIGNFGNRIYTEKIFIYTLGILLALNYI